MSSDALPMHPLRLCKEVRDFLRRDAILVVDGQEILNFGRQAIPTYVPGHRLNSGAFGTMGVGLPYGVGAKVARPDKQVLVLHGDGSFGMNAMDIDTAVRHKIPVVCVISNNGGWTADAPWTRPLPKPGRHLGHTRYDRMAIDLGAHGEHVEKPHDIRPALERAFASGSRPSSTSSPTTRRARRPCASRPTARSRTTRGARGRARRRVPLAISRNATALPGRDERLGGWGPGRAPWRTDEGVLDHSRSRRHQGRAARHADTGSPNLVNSWCAFAPPR